MKEALDKSRVISAAELATVSNINNLTCDRIEALAGGHGMLNIALHSIANVLTEEILNGSSISVKNANARKQPMEDVMLKAINAAKDAGADGANAALLVAGAMLLAGSPAQVGIPAGNRKLGATARMLAGVDRSGVAAIPTLKMNNKISGFAAVMAIYQAMMEGKLSPVDGRKVPKKVAGGAQFGHSTLGEDIVWPAMSENGARIGTQAMMDTMAGASIKPDPFTAAIFGTAAILEIIHADAEVPEGMGAYGRTSSAYLAGKAAAATAGLPEKLVMHVTGEEYDTGKLIGDIDVILKDIGAPSVVGMIAFHEIFACFKGGLSGSSGGANNPPLGHISSYAIIAMKALIANNGDKAAAAEAMANYRLAATYEPDTAMLSINTISRKAMELKSGPVTDTLIMMTEPYRANAIHRRAEHTYESIKNGKTVAEVVKGLDDKRLESVEKRVSAIFSEELGVPVEIKINKIGPAARRTGKLIEKYMSLDPNVDVTVKAGEKTAVMEGFVHNIIPAVTLGEEADVAWAVPIAAPAVAELVNGGNNIINLVIPAAVAAAMGANEPKEAAELAFKGSYVTAGIPGAKEAAERVATLAASIINDINISNINI